MAFLEPLHQRRVSARGWHTNCASAGIIKARRLACLAAWLRSALAALVLFSANPVHAFPKPPAYCPDNWRGGCQAPDLLPSGDAVCATVTSPPVSPWGFNSAGAQPGCNTSSTSECRIGSCDNGNYLVRFVPGAGSCPANSTLSGGQCTCNAGYEPKGTPTTCVPQPTDESGCGTVNPVQPGTGRKRFTETDYSGAGAHPLSLVRHYSSRWTDSIAATGLTSIAAWDGGWRHSHQASITLLTDGNLRAYRPDGTILGLAASTTVANTWTAAGSRDTVTALVDAVGTRTGYTITAAADDSVETYDATGKLLTLKARNGWLTTLTYSDATTPAAIAPRPGLLTSVKNHFGRELRFTHDPQGRIAEVLPPGAISGQPAGSAISPIRYVYNEPASLGTGTPAQSQLTSIVWQDGSVRRYHHEDGRWPQAVTGITDEAGVRYGTYAYDAQGRVTRSELAGGAERLDFAYATDANGKPTTAVTDYTGAGGAATTRSYTFTDIGNVRYPASLTAPCSLCGSTQQSSTYDAQGNPTKQIAHDGSVTFIAYDAKGRETERATFPSSYQSATTRPALSAASKVISTQWHATFNLPTQIAEPNKTTANTYSSKGLLSGQSWTATTDATGAATFAAVKTGSTYATTWSYSASNLATAIVTNETPAGARKAVETGRWSFVFNALGDATKITATEAGTRSVATLTSSAAHGLLTQLSADNGAVARFTYNTRNLLSTAQLPDYGATMTYDARALLTEIRFGPSNWLRILYDPAGNPLRLEDSAGQSQLIVGMAEPSGLGGRSQAVAAAAGARIRALLSSLRDPATATKWLPLASARAQTSTAAVPARILQGMSLAQTQQAALALDIPNLAGDRTCCSAGGAGSGAGSSQTVRDYLNRVTMPIQMMGYAATEISGALADEILIQKSAYKLKKNLCAAGVNKPEFGCHHAHHIVAVADWRAANSRAILASANVGIDVNDACNGMFVPCDKHGKLHTTLYYTKVETLLTGLAVKNRATVCLQLNLIRADIASGNFP